ncbi:hypothetical protein [Duganella vulcania]|uniref:Integrase catalytic domain-containing protein n=1 Tax=Duganella vulcania TaxID=2692166 RepID=A0A845GTA5_9BURK|nr:hypothetical protein [Duganella vulcania]MYM95907.1 hypothetical protein [Duganella vulcania]
MKRIVFAAISAIFLLIQNVSAVSLNGRTNDDSVCDLSPYTTSRLGQLTFVPARTPNIEAIYARLAMRFIVSSCHLGQTVILHSDDGSRFEDQYFTDVATRLCGAANIVREPFPTAEQPHAFRVKCQIIQLKTAELWLRAAETSESTEAMINKGVATSAKSDQVPVDQVPAARRQECKHGLTFGALTGLSGGCRN